MNNKGQITVYIIVGIIILFSIVVSIYIANRVWLSPAEISPIATPVKDYVEVCIQQVGADALIPIGTNGGYMNPLVDAEVSQSPAEGDVLFLSEDAKHAVPYWFYMSTENTCKNCMMESRQPTLEQVKKEVDSYVNEHLDECINSFRPFLDQDYEFEVGDVDSDVLFTEASTRFVVNYPIKIIQGSTKSSIEDFETVVDIPFKRIYDLAGRITKQERESAFLESITMHFISLHTGLDMSKLPPLAAITHDKVTVNWFKPMIALNLQQLFLSYVPLMQIAGTKDAKQITAGDNTFEQGFLKGLYLKFLEDDYPFNVNFAYLDWPLYFDISPRQGDVLTGEVHIQEFPFNAAPAFQTNYYEFYYDLSAPVLVEIRDPNALRGKGYSFNFALELNIRDNKNFIYWNLGEGTVGYWNDANVDVNEKVIKYDYGTCYEQGSSWKCDITSKTYSDEIACVQACTTSKTSTRKFKPKPTMFKDIDQKISGEITINALDAVTNQGIDKASVLYKCGRYDTIIVGATDASGTVKEKFPLCINGQLSIDKDGYAKKIIGLTIKPDQSKILTVSLEPEAEVTATVKKYTIKIKNLRELEYAEEPEAELSTSYSDIDSWESLGMSALGGFKDQIIMPLSLSVHWEEEGYKVGREQKTMNIYDRYCCDAPVALNASQKAIVMIEKIPEDELEPHYFQTMLLDYGERQDTLKLIPGLYKVNGMLVDQDGFVIEEGCQEICVEYDMGTEYYVGTIGQDLVDPLGGAPEEKPDCKEWGLFPEQDIVAQPAMLGGVVLDNQTGYWNITRADLNRGNVELFFIQTLRPTCTLVQDCVLDVCVDIAETQATSVYSKKYRTELEPIFR
ncbi:hypothetical protein KY333_05325 [Candidatus Woesearchaeota archaeon]|nr:hypothetical protein [Candidatus Woesearchaeota archaeon]MBW2993796.1 hypothetical protein [Candidatus Woesearchaeota archaeon]